MRLPILWHRVKVKDEATALLQTEVLQDMLSKNGLYEVDAGARDEDEDEDVLAEIKLLAEQIKSKGGEAR